MLSHKIEGPWPGELAIIPRPRGGDWLDDEARALKDHGFGVVVSLLTREEAQELGLEDEADLFGGKDCSFVTTPFPIWEYQLRAIQLWNFFRLCARV